jgi:hypothetical protein
LIHSRQDNTRNRAVVDRPVVSVAVAVLVPVDLVAVVVVVVQHRNNNHASCRRWLSTLRFAGILARLTTRNSLCLL